MVSVVENNPFPLMTQIAGIEADLSDVYTVGFTIASAKTKLYSGEETGYSIGVLSQDFNKRTMTFSVRK